MKLVPPEEAKRTFRSTFGQPSSLAAQSSGRVNLIGEHTDYNGGFVLPTGIPQGTRVLVARRNDEQVRAVSSSLPNAHVEYNLGRERRAGGWADYVQGVSFVLARAGHRLTGFDALIESTVPMGSGLSSSAALEVALIRGLRELFGLTINDLTLARLCQQVENDFVGARVGIMDPVAASFAEPGIAILLDTRSLEIERIAMPLNRMDLVVINSGVSHRNADGGYNARRAECEEACRQLGVAELRDVSDLSPAAALPHPLNKRVRHVFTENARVLHAAAALRAGDVRTLGQLFYESHRSMRDDYEVSVPEIDLLVQLASAERAVLGARLTGGGFGGSIVLIAEKDEGAVAAKSVCAQYVKRTTRTPTVLVGPSLE